MAWCSVKAQGELYLYLHGMHTMVTAIEFQPAEPRNTRLSFHKSFFPTSKDLFARLLVPRGLRTVLWISDDTHPRHFHRDVHPLDYVLHSESTTLLQ
jgi:hypothetical protein